MWTLLILQQLTDHISNIVQVDGGALKARVAELKGCLVASSPAMQCDVARALITASGAPVQHYIGVLHTVSKDSQVGLTSRSFATSFLATLLVCSNGLFMTSERFCFGNFQSQVYRHHRAPDASKTLS